MNSLGVCILLVKLFPYQNIFCSKMLTRKEKKQVNMCTKKLFCASNLLKWSTCPHVYQRELHSHTTGIKLSSITLHVDTGFLLLAGASSKVGDKRHDSVQFFLSLSTHLFSSQPWCCFLQWICFPDEISSCNDFLHFCLLPNSSTAVELDWYWLLRGLNALGLLISKAVGKALFTRCKHTEMRSKHRHGLRGTSDHTVPLPVTGQITEYCWTMWTKKRHSWLFPLQFFFTYWKMFMPVTKEAVLVTAPLSSVTYCKMFIPHNSIQNRQRSTSLMQ